MTTKRHLERMVRLAHQELEQCTIALFLHENKQRHARLKALRKLGHPAIPSKEFDQLYLEEAELLGKHHLHWSPSKGGWALRNFGYPLKATK
jgi:hypothetical protein